MWRGTVQKFSSGGSGFDPSETEKVRVVGVDQIRQCSRMKRMENGADVESAIPRHIYSPNCNSPCVASPAGKPTGEA